MTDPVVSCRGVEVVRDGRTILGPLDLTLQSGEHLAVLGPNGCGKTTLLRLLSTYLHPTRGRVEVLGAPFGRVDLRPLRNRIGVVSAGVVGLLHRLGTAETLVASARHGATRPVPEITAGDREFARAALDRVGAGHLSTRTCKHLSQGEWQRVQIARALVLDPDLLLLDEPFVGLDLGGRESLIADLTGLLDAPDGPTTVLVTHHVEELPPNVGQALLLRDGAVVAAGAVDDVLVSELVSKAFDVDVTVDREAGRHRARVRLDG